jgi:hypothetical protein
VVVRIVIERTFFNTRTPDVMFFVACVEFSGAAQHKKFSDTDRCKPTSTCILVSLARDISATRTPDCEIRGGCRPVKPTFCLLVPCSGYNVSKALKIRHTSNSRVECLRFSNKYIIRYLLENDVSRPFRIF